MDTQDTQRMLEYLLISELNRQNYDEIGMAGHDRLIRLFLTLFGVIGTPAVFCDIGANDGSTGTAVKKLFPSARVLSVEANPNIHRMYVDNVTAKGVEYLNLAVSSTDGPVTIFVPRVLSRGCMNGEVFQATIHEPVNTGKSSLLRRDEEAVYEEYQVPGLQLDHLLKDALETISSRTIALWIDVEGAAESVLAGASETLSRTSMIFIETENFPFWQGQKLAGEITATLIAKGFVPISRDREYGDKQFNTVFIHSSLVAALYTSIYSLKPHAPSAPEKAPTQPVAPVAPNPVRVHNSLASSILEEIPIFIPTFNNPTYVLQMLQQLNDRHLRNIHIVDNGSTYPPMLQLLSQLDGAVRITHLRHNQGPRHLFLDEDNLLCLPDYFCITDPDLRFNPEMPQDFLLMLLKLTNSLQIGKAGFALDIQDRDQMRAEKFNYDGEHLQIWEWEERYWKVQAGFANDGSPIYHAAIDTTFALYNKKFFKPENFLAAVRIAGKYTCKHLPWYKNVDIPVAERNFYRTTQQHSSYLQ